MSNYKFDADAHYAKTHEWVRIEGDLAVIGISDAAQDMLSDVVYVELPEEGESVEAGKKAAVVESVKAAEEVISPVSGVVVEVNGDLMDQPELVNSDPYSAWFYKVQVTESLKAQFKTLMDSDAYDAFVDQAEH